MGLACLRRGRGVREVSDPARERAENVAIAYLALDLARECHHSRMATFLCLSCTVESMNRARVIYYAEMRKIEAEHSK